ncbi:MAG: hydrogenase maturation protease [Spirochaetota bacterium]|nr:hydrogenase maturation protease [Spirochaetota bacterium]
MKNILILGIGNILQSDDGLGVYIVNHLMESDIQLPEGIEIIDGGTAGFDLLDVMAGRDKIIIIDALETDDTPGSVYRFTPNNLIDSRSMISLHEVGIMEVAKLLNLMGSEPEIEFIGIVPEDISTTDICISKSVKESIPVAIEQILDAAINI